MENKKSRILLYDIETSPNLGYYFELYKEGNIVWNKDNWYILSFAWKWLGETTTRILSLPDFKSYKKDPENDKELVTELWKLFNEADIIIAHNGNSFDQKKSQARFVVHGLTPPHPYKQIDTKTVAKKYFRFDSNKLDDLGKILGLGEKLETGGYGLWKKVMSGDKKAWSLMCKYNKQDVVLLEKVYLKLRPWMGDTHPFVGNECPVCSSTKLNKRGIARFKDNRIAQRFQCTACGAWTQGKKEKI